MKKICNIIGDILIVTIILLSMMITILTLITNKDGIPSIYGYSPFSIQSNSMYPTFKKGDLIITDNKVDVNSLKVNDIISFFAYEEGTNIVKTHRIVNIQKENDAIWFETKGDNNDVEDNVIITDIDVIGKQIKKISYIGGIIDFFKSKWVFFFIILIPLCLLFLYQLAEFIKLLIEYKDVEEDD